MKKIISLLFLLGICTTIQYTYASSVGATEITQVLNNAELVGVNISDAATSISQGISTVKQSITDPIMAGLISVAQQQATNDILSWANGGFNGTPSIIGNPEKYIINAGLDSVKTNLYKVPTNSVLGDSIFSAIVNNNKQVSIATQLKDLSKSPTASIIQHNACDDPNTLLEKAQKEVEASGGTQEEINARYTAFYDAICAGDPDTDPAVANKIDNLAKQDPSLGGWDLWLATTGGRNKATQIAQSVQIVDEAKKTQQTFADKGIYQGEGAVSQKVCDTYVNDTTQCESYTTVTPGKAVQDAISKAALAPLDRVSNLTGADGFNAILTGFITQALTKGLNSAISSIKSSSANTSVTLTAKSPVVQDLASDPSKKTTLTGPITKQLDYMLTSLTNLETIDNQFLFDMGTYEAKITAGRSCYNTLVNDYPSLANDTTVTSAFAFYTERQGRVDAIKNTINPEKISITQAKQLIADTTAKVAASNSTQEISSIYSDYSAKIDAGNYPTTQTEGVRSAQYKKAKGDVANDTDMGKYLTSCSTLRQNQGYQSGGN